MTLRVNQDRWKLKGTHQLSVNADNSNFLCKNTNNINNSTVAILVTSNEVGTAVNAEKTKCMVMSCEQNAGQIHNIKAVIKSFLQQSSNI